MKRANCRQLKGITYILFAVFRVHEKINAKCHHGKFICSKQIAYEINGAGHQKIMIWRRKKSYYTKMYTYTANWANRIPAGKLEFFRGKKWSVCFFFRFVRTFKLGMRLIGKRIKRFLTTKRNMDWFQCRLQRQKNRHRHKSYQQSSKMKLSLTPSLAVILTISDDDHWNSYDSIALIIHFHFIFFFLSIEIIRIFFRSLQSSFNLIYIELKFELQQSLFSSTTDSNTHFRWHKFSKSYKSHL